MFRAVWLVNLSNIEVLRRAGKLARAKVSGGKLYTAETEESVTLLCIHGNHEARPRLRWATRGVLFSHMGSWALTKAAYI